jgi:hypothetical protein
MGRTKLRGLEVAGIRIAVEVPPSLQWAWPGALGGLACLPVDPDIYVSVRVGAPQHTLADSVLYTHQGGTFEVGRAGDDRLIAVHGASKYERLARFDAGFRSGEIVVSPAVAERREYPISSPLDELIVIQHAIRHGALVVRGAVAVSQGRALVFLGDAEPPAADSDVQVASGWLVLRAEDDGYRVHWVPWSLPGSACVATPIAARLGGLHTAVPAGSGMRSPAHLTPDDAAAELLRHVFAPVHEPEYAETLLASATDLARRIPLIALSPPRAKPFPWRQGLADMAFAPPLGV